MSRRPWHRRFHEDALNGMRDLSLEERGAYNTLLDMIYERGARLVDDDRVLANRMGPGCSVRKWVALKTKLAALGKIYISDGFIGNFRTDRELADEIAFHTERTEAGRRGGEKSAEKRRNYDPENSPKKSREISVSKKKANEDSDGAVDQLQANGQAKTNHPLPQESNPSKSSSVTPRRAALPPDGGGAPVAAGKRAQRAAALAALRTHAEAEGAP